MREPAPVWQKILIIIACCLLAGWLIFADCFFFNIIGLPCPLCGIRRALWSQLQGDLTDAFRMHPLFWILPLLAGWLILGLFRQKYLQLFKHKSFWLSLLMLFLAVYLCRMVFIFPHRPPLVINKDALIFRLWQLLRQFLRT